MRRIVKFAPGLRLIAAFAPIALFAMLINSVANADTTSVSLSWNSPLVPVELRLDPGARHADFVRPLTDKLFNHNMLLKPVIFPRGGVATGGGGTGDVAIPVVGAWAEWTNTAAGNLIAQLPAATNDQNGCNRYDAANAAACGQSKAGTMALTGASISGTTLTIPSGGLAALTTGSTTINNGDVIAAASGAATILTGGTYVAAGGPVTTTSCATGCTLTLSASQIVSAENMVTNPPALQAASVSSTVGNTVLSSILPFSGIGFDPASSCGLLWQSGGHAVANTVGTLAFCLSDVEAGSGTANWKLVQNPPPLYPTSWGLNGTPASGIPGFSYQTFGAGDFIAAANFGISFNSGGVYGQVACHEYHFLNTAPNGWSGLTTIGGASCGNSGNDNLGAGFFVDMADYSVHGPVYVAPTTPEAGVSIAGLHQGYLPEFGGDLAGHASAAFGPDGNFYGVAADSVPGPWLGVLKCPLGNYQNRCAAQMGTDSAPTWHSLGVGTGCFPGYNPALVVNDPGNSGRTLFVVYGTATNCQSGGSGTTGATHLEFISNINVNAGGHSGTYNNLTISGSLPTWYNACDGINDCNISIAHFSDADTATSVAFLVSDGGPHLAKIVLNWTGAAYTATATDLSSSSGSPPPLPSATTCGSGGASSDATLAYKNLKGYQLAIVSYCARMFVYDIAHVCPPVGSQAPDGTLIGAPTACTEQDSGANVWAFGAAATTGRMDQRQANYIVNKNGSDSGLVAYELNIAQSGQQFFHQACGPISVWLDSSGRQVPSPTGAAFINHAIQTNPSVNYRTLRIAETSGNVSGATITIDTQSGVPFWYDTASIGHSNGPSTVTSGMRIVGQSGAALYCGSSGNGGVLEQYFDTINASGSANLFVSDLELGYNHALTNQGPNSCFNNVAGAANPTLLRLSLSNCDMGLESDSGAGVLAATAVKIWRMGGDTGTGAPSHGVYLSGHDATTSAVFNGGYSRCPYTTEQDPMNLDTIGFNFKSRYAKLNIYNYTVAQPSLRYDTACVQQTQHDYSCGGQITMGAADPVITPASLTSSGTTATITLPTATASAGTYNSTTGIVTLTVPSTNFLPGTPIVVSGATGTGSFAAINGEQVSQTGSGTTLTFAIETGLTMTITGATVQFELPYQIGDTFTTTVFGASPSAYNGTVTATVATLTTATYTFAGGTSPATGTITFTIPGGGVTEYGPDTISGANGMIRVGAEIGVMANCPTTSPYTIAAAGSSYNSGTGQVTITLTGTITDTITGNRIVVTAITGTGCASLVNSVANPYTTTALPSGTSVTFNTGITGLSCTITGGSVIFPSQYAVNAVTITNWTFVNDKGVNDPTTWIDMPVVYLYGHPFPVTFVNCKFINPRATSLSDAMGVGTTDGGGNVLYHSRADWATGTGITTPAASSYPYIPPVSLLEPANDNELRQVA